MGSHGNVSLCWEDLSTAFHLILCLDTLLGGVWRLLGVRWFFMPSESGWG